jgi:thiol-disulfide isomerase/thioredoxin
MRIIRKIFILLLLYSSAYCQTSAQQYFLITGKVAKLKGKLFLSYENSEGVYQTDSTTIRSNAFRFKCRVSQPALARITNVKNGTSIRANDAGTLQFFMEPSNISIDLSKGFGAAKVTGSKNHDEWLRQNNQTKVLSNRYAALRNRYEILNDNYEAKQQGGINDPILLRKMEDIEKEMSLYEAQMEKINKAYIEEHPNSYVAAHLLAGYISTYTLPELKRIYFKMPLNLKESSSGKELATEIDKIAQSSVGSKAPLFATKELNGDTLKLDAFIGKYVLLDFWASWCKPCRAGNPELLMLYKKYKEKGLEFIGVADDDSDEGSWRTAVAKDGINIWKHVLRGYNPERPLDPHDISDSYAIQVLPTKILIDTSGIIIGRFVGAGEASNALAKQMKELFEQR